MRKTAAETRAASKAAKTQVLVPTTEGPSVSTRSARTRKRGKASTIASTSVSPAPDRQELPVPQVSTVVPAAAIGGGFGLPEGRSESVYFEDLGKFGKILRDENRSLEVGGSAYADLAGILAREQGSSDAIAHKVVARARVIRGMMKQLEPDLDGGSGRQDRSLEAGPSRLRVAESREPSPGRGSSVELLADRDVEEGAEAEEEMAED